MTADPYAGEWKNSGLVPFGTFRPAAGSTALIEPCVLSCVPCVGLPPVLLSIARSAVPVEMLAEKCSATTVQNKFQLLQTVMYGPRKRSCGCSVVTVSTRPPSAAFVVGALAR